MSIGIRLRTVAVATGLSLVAGLVVAAWASPGSAATRDSIVAVAESELNNSSHNQEVPLGTNCNYYSGYWNDSSSVGCAAGFESAEWCADFARYVWHAADVADLTGLNFWAYSFAKYGYAHGTLHLPGSGYTPQPGDALVFDRDTPYIDLSAIGSYSDTQLEDIDHVGLVESYSGGTVHTIAGNNSDNRIGQSDWALSDSSIRGFISPAGLTPSAAGVHHRLRHPDGSWTVYGDLGMPSTSAVADAADPAGKNNVVALVNGQVYHQQRLANGSWTGWGPVGTPGTGIGTDVAASTDNGGNLHVVVVVNGQIWHTIRYASSGAWSPWGLVGNPGSAVTSVAAAIDTSRSLLNLIVVAGGQIYHLQRFSDGSWGGWGVVGAPGSAAPVDVTAAADNVGNLQVATVTADGGIWHEIRTASTGGWSGWGLLGDPAGTTITAASAAVDPTNGSMQLSVIANGQVWHRIRNTDGSWGSWGPAGNPGTALALAGTIDTAGNLQLITTY